MFWIPFLALSTVATGASIRQSRKAEKANRRAAALERRKAEIANLRERRKSIAETRQQQALVRAKAAAQGVEGSSAVEGAVGSLRSQSASAIGFSGQMERFNQSINRQTQRASTAQSKAGTFDAISGLSGQVGMAGFSDWIGRPDATS